MSAAATRRFCASVVSGMDKRAAAELRAALEPRGLLDLSNTKQGKIFFTLPAAAVGGALAALASLQHAEHVYAVLLEGDFPDMQAGDEDGGDGGTLRPDTVGSLPERVLPVLWGEAAAAARELQRLQRGDDAVKGRTAAQGEVVQFRADCKAGKQSHYVRRAASAAFAKCAAPALSTTP
jgi:hypothetical protein